MNANDPKCGNNFNTQQSVIWYVYIIIYSFELCKALPVCKAISYFYGRICVFLWGWSFSFGPFTVRRLTRNWSYCSPFVGHSASSRQVLLPFSIKLASLLETPKEWSWSVSLCGHGCTIPFANPLRRMCDSMWFWGTVLEKIMTSMWYDVVCWFFPGSIDVKGLSFHTFFIFNQLCMLRLCSVDLFVHPSWLRTPEFAAMGETHGVFARAAHPKLWIRRCHESWVQGRRAFPVLAQTLLQPSALI